MIVSELDMSCIEEIVAQCGMRREAVVPILQAIQRRYHYLPRSALQRVCELTDITPADIMGVSTFYTHFRHQPVGRHMIHVCEGTACHVKGAGEVLKELEKRLGIKPGETTPDGAFSLETEACFGSCALAPVVVTDEHVHGRMTPSRVNDILRGEE